MELRAVLHKVSPEEYGKLQRFDMDKKPLPQQHYLRPVSWLLSLPDSLKHKLKITKTGMEGLKAPFMLICNHSSFLDFKVTTMALFPRRSNYVVAIDGFIGRETILRMAGGILKRRVTNDVRLIRHLRTLLTKHRSIISIYPEARYSLIGTRALLPESMGKLIKLCKVPVVILKMHGNYLTSPVWNLPDRGSPVEAEMSRLFDLEDIRNLSVADLYDRLNKALEYDEYRWQWEQKIRIEYKDRAKGLHHVIYHCPACGVQHEMDSAGDSLWCGSCHKKWVMDEYGRMHAEKGETEFEHLPDWFEFQCEEVRKELDAGSYRFEDQVRVESLVNKLGYYDLGSARVIHTAEGFVMEGDQAFFPEKLIRKPLSMYSCHIEYEYFGKGDAFELSTLHETYYLYPIHRKNIVTKILIATEEIHKRALEEAKIQGTQDVEDLGEMEKTLDHT